MELFYDAVNRRLAEGKAVRLQLFIKLILTSGSAETAVNPNHLVPGLPELSPGRGPTLKAHLLWAKN